MAVYIYKSELYHHGILGQKWGVRNGPPYPLSTSARSASEKRAGWKRSLTSEGKSGSMLRGTRESEIERLRRRYSNVGDSGTSLSNVTGDAKRVANACGFSLKSKPATISDDVRATNPDWYNHQDEIEWMNNCTHSVIAFAARRKGLDVVATPMNKSQQHGETMPNTCNWYFKHEFDITSDLDKNKDFKWVQVQTVANTLGGLLTTNGMTYERRASREVGKIYKEAPDGSYGMVQTIMINGSGHVFVWYKEDGQIKFADSQGGINAKPDFQRLALYGMGVPKGMVTVRLDDKELNEERLHEAVMPAPSSRIRHSTIVGKNQKTISRGVHMNELYHYGIPGMKWGVRRYQNPDGTLTAAGKARIGKGNESARSSKIHKEVAKDFRTFGEGMESASKVSRSASEIARRSGERARKKAYREIDVSQMSDKELQAAINRLNLERNYKTLTSAEVSVGHDYVSSILSTIGDVVTIGAGVAGIAATVHTLRS